MNRRFGLQGMSRSSKNHHLVVLRIELNGKPSNHCSTTEFAPILKAAKSQEYNQLACERKMMRGAFLRLKEEDDPLFLRICLIGSKSLFKKGLWGS